VPAKRRRVFLVDWDPVSAAATAAPLRKAGWTVAIESRDGAVAGRKILAQPPDAVVISLGKLPSHGRQIASGVRGYKGPIVFLGGTRQAITKTRERVPDASFVEASKLLWWLGSLSRRRTARAGGRPAP